MENNRKVKFKEIRELKEIQDYMKRGNDALGALGFTDHSIKHAALVSTNAAMILEKLGYDAHFVELARIAGYMHDIGNCVNRNDHAHNGAIMAFQILRDLKMDSEDIAVIVNTIGEHDEKTGVPVDAVSAAVILADKMDVRRNRVRTKPRAQFDKHDRVNYAVLSSSLQIDEEKKQIVLELELDEEICSMMEYFEIFLERMLMCRRAAEILGYKFKLRANGNKVI